MAHDEVLAARIRALLGNTPNVIEKAMFGGVAWMFGGYMFVGIVKNELMVRVGPDAHDAAVAHPHARIMDFTGRPMRGYVFVAPKGFETDAMLREWIRRGESFVRTLPTRKESVAKKPGKRK